MPGPKATRVYLTPKQKALLEELIRRRKGPQQLVLRAKIILASDTHATNEQIAQHLAINRLTVRTWRQRWATAADTLIAIEEQEGEKVLSQHITAVLSDERRSGTPATFTAEQICQVLALACESPEESGRPISHWTPRELADEAIKRGLVGSISPRHLGRFLKSGRTQTSPQSLLA